MATDYRVGQQVGQTAGAKPVPVLRADRRYVDTETTDQQYYRELTDQYGYSPLQARKYVAARAAALARRGGRDNG